MADNLNNDVNESVSEGNNDSNPTDVQDYQAVKGIIQRLAVQLDELKERQKDYKQRIKNLLENDLELSQLEEQAKNASDGMKKRKQQLMNSLEAKEAKAKAKEIAEEMADIQDSLTNHLLNYFQITGTQSFDTISGGEREFKLTAKLMPPKK